MNTDLLKGAAIQVYFETASGIIINFVAKLVFELNKRDYEIIRFDTAHGCPHKDVLNVEGKLIRKIWYDFLDYKQALDVAITHTHWEKQLSIIIMRKP